MTVKQFTKLKKGNYKLTDGIYDYEMTVSYSDDKSKLFQIKEFGSLFSSRITIFKNKDGISSMAKVGGLTIHSDNYSDLIHELTQTA